MPTSTTNYDLIKPNVNSADDEDLWGGQLNENLDTIDTQMKANEDAADTGWQSAYPVGSIYLNASVSTNPSTLLGFGTWASLGEGRVLVGIGTGTDDNAVDKTFTAAEEGGEYEHTLTENEMPAHTHEYIHKNAPNTSAGDADGSSPNAGEQDTSSTGGDAAHNIIQPYLAVYMWERTA